MFSSILWRVTLGHLGLAESAPLRVLAILRIFSFSESAPLRVQAILEHVTDLQKSLYAGRRVC